LRVLVAGLLVAIAVWGGVRTHTHARETYSYAANCHNDADLGGIVCEEGSGIRRPPGADPDAVIIALAIVATALLIAVSRRLSRSKAYLFATFVLAGWALAFATAPSLYVYLGSATDGGLSGREHAERDITLTVGPIAAGFLVYAAVLALARARQLDRRYRIAIGAGAASALVVLIVSFLVLNAKNYFPSAS